MVEDEEMFLLIRRISVAVILRALCDLKKRKSTYIFRTARNFCLGTTKNWQMSRNLYCELADISVEKVIQTAQIYIQNNNT